MKTTKLTITSLLMLVFSLVSISDTVNANPNDGHYLGHHSPFSSPLGQGMEHQFKRMAKYLGLSAEQRQQIKVIKEQSKLNHMTSYQELQAFKELAKPLVMAETFDEQAFTALQSQYQATFAQLALQKAKTRHEIYQLLTAEQKEKMQAMLERKAQRFQ